MNDIDSERAACENYKLKLVALERECTELRTSTRKSSQSYDMEQQQVTSLMEQLGNYEKQLKVYIVVTSSP